MKRKAQKHSFQVNLGNALMLNTHLTIWSLFKISKRAIILHVQVYPSLSQAYTAYSITQTRVLQRCGCRSHTVNSTNPNGPLSSHQKCSGHAGITPQGFERLLPWAPTGWLWATLTQPLSWEETETFSEYRGNHQSTKEQGIPHTHTQLTPC